MGCTTSKIPEGAMPTQGSLAPSQSELNPPPKKSYKDTLPPNTFESPLVRRAKENGLDVVNTNYTDTASKIDEPKNGDMVKDLFNAKSDESKHDEWTLEDICTQMHGFIINNASFTDIKKFVALIPSSLEIKNKEGLTPLHLAAKLGKLEAIKILIDLRADTNARTNDGDTPLHLAIGYHHFDCAIKLKSNGSLEDLINEKGFKAKLGYNGISCFGLAALYSATTVKQVDVAFKICSQYIDDVNLAQFIDASAIAKKVLLFKGWGKDQDTKYQEILNQIKQKEKEPKPLPLPEQQIVPKLPLIDKPDPMNNMSRVTTYDGPIPPPTFNQTDPPALFCNFGEMFGFIAN